MKQSLAVVLTVLLVGPALAQEKPRVVPKTVGERPWTLASAYAAVERSPRDPYLQFVYLQLMRNAPPKEAKKYTPPPWVGFDWWTGRRRQRPSVDAFSLFTGAHAVQESLQMDAMAPPGLLDDTMPPPWPPPTPVKKDGPLTGPTVKSHPWREMLAGKRPAVSDLSRMTPEDFYLIEFGSPGKLIGALEEGGDWLALMQIQAANDARDARAIPRLLKQLLLDVSPALRPLYDANLGHVAVVGSDPFVSEGSDVTVLFEVKAPKLFQAFTDDVLSKVSRATGQKVVQSTHKNVTIQELTTPDRSIRMFAADPRPGLHVRSNSRVALVRVLDTIQGTLPNLGDSDEFRYIRTLMPLGAPEEDGIVYLSDAFIRNLVGPRTKIVERRRLMAFNHLRMIAHGAQLHLTQFGVPATSLEQLEVAGCLPGDFNRHARYTSPLGGTYSLSADGLSGVCSVLGNTSFLTPCLELDYSKATPDEDLLYRQFVADYNQYWRQFFDPIVVRLKLEPTKLRAETLILPLIDNSIYTGMARYLGGKTEPLDPLPVPAKNLFSISLKVDKKAAFEQFRWVFQPRGLKNLEPADEILAKKLEAALDKGLGNQIGVHFYDHRIMFDASLQSFVGEMVGMFSGPGGRDDNVTRALPIVFGASSLFSPMYVSMPLEDGKLIDDLLEAYDAVAVRRNGIRERTFFFDQSFEFHHLTTRGGHTVRAYCTKFGPITWRMYVARIGKGLYITNQTDVIDDLHALAKEAPKEPAVADLGPDAHGMVRVRAKNWSAALPGYQHGWESSNRQACCQSMQALEGVARAHGSFLKGTPEERGKELAELTARLHGFHHACPDGGTYRLEPDGTLRCDIHGTVRLPRQKEFPEPASAVARRMGGFRDMTAALTFLPEGLRAVVVIERK